jgi:DNA polymerase-3 subunit delta'
LVVVAAPETGKGVKVEAVREMITSLSLRPQYAHSRVVVMPNADSMNRFSANSLLKTLEEPDSHTKFLLLAEMPGSIPATIRSRCQRLAVKMPHRSVTLDWLGSKLPSLSPPELDAKLTLARGAPLRALELDMVRVQARREVLVSFMAIAEGSADPVVTAAQWEKLGTEDLVGCLISWLEDLVRLSSAPRTGATNNPDFANALRAIAGRLDVRSLYRCLDRSYRAKTLLSGQINRLLLLEELAIHWSRVSAGI